MNYEFENGTDEQQERWVEAAHLLLNLPFAAINLAVEVKFVDVGEVTNEGHTDLAITAFSYGSHHSTTRVRDDAPRFGTEREAIEAAAAGYGVRYDPISFFRETAAHELGHSAFAALPIELRLAIVGMFGLDTDDIDVLAPAGQPWEEHVIEGIAETFKEAFLPARYRVFPNRTKRQIPYRLFPEFRRIFRNGLISSATFTYIYGDEYPWKVFLGDWAPLEGGPGSPFLPTYESEHDDEAFVFYEKFEDFEECWGIDMSQFPESGLHPFSISEEGIET